MFQLLNANKYFFIPYLFFLIVGALVLSIFEKAEIHIYINQMQPVFFDLFFKYFTHLADGVVSFVTIVIFLFVKYRYSLIIFISTIISTIILRFFKDYLMPEAKRPIRFFSEYDLLPSETLRLIEGVDVHMLKSFPSGHSVTAFSIYLLLGIFCNHNYIKFLFFGIALLSAFSRVYLSQHFLIDVYFGSIIGSTVSFFSFFWFMKVQNPKLDLCLLSKKNLYGSEL